MIVPQDPVHNAPLFLNTFSLQEAPHSFSTGGSNLQDRADQTLSMENVSWNHIFQI